MDSYPVSPATLEILKSLDALSSQGLLRRYDVGVLLEVAVKNGLEDVLGKLSFEAKFVSQSVRILERAGNAAPGTERLCLELSSSVERAGDLLRALLNALDGDQRVRLEEEYLVLRRDAMQNLITLCHDLRWYKNLQIDRSRGKRTRKKQRP